MTEEKTKHDLQLYLTLIGISIIFSLIVINLFSGFKQLPSPLFGGDYYYQLGSVYHIYYSQVGDWFKSSSSLDDRPTYSPIYSVVVALFGKAVGMSPMQSMFYVNIPFIFLVVFTSCFLFHKLTKNRTFAMIGVLLFLPFTALPILKYTELAQLFAIPLFLLSLYMLYERQTWPKTIALGASYGLLALLHPTGLVIGTAFMILFMAHSALSHSFNSPLSGGLSPFLRSLADTKKTIANIKASSIFFVTAFVIGFLIAQIWWFEPIFMYFGKSPARVSEWGFQDFSSTTYQLIFLVQTLMEYLFNFSSPFGILLSALGIAGLYFLFIKRGEGPEYTFILLVSLGAFMLTFHYFLTVPVAGTFFAPNYMVSFIFRPALIMAGLFAVSKARSVPVDGSDILKNAKYLPHLIIIILLADVFFSYDSWYNSQWKQVGRTPIDPQITALQAFILANTSINDVFLSTNELSFMINAISGRKTVAFRRGHVDPFSNLDEREIAAAVILYGNNTEEKIKLIREYNISYLYYDPYWARSEWAFDDNGKVVGAFDPLAVFDTPENRAALEANNIQYLPQNTWLDPSMVGGFYKKVDILYTTPNNYEFREGAMWKKDLDSLLEVVWKNEKTGATIYKIRI